MAAMSPMSESSRFRRLLAALAVAFAFALVLGAVPAAAQDPPLREPDRHDTSVDGKRQDAPAKRQDAATERKDTPEKATRPSLDGAVTIAIGDVHGDALAFVRLLRSLELVDDDGHWKGGTKRLIQTGDLVDRGRWSRLVVELVMRLEREAAAAGGRVTTLLGNHEVMNLAGDTRYVTAEDFAAYVDDKTDALRARRRQEILSRIDTGSPLLRSEYYRGLARFINARSFDRVFPRGYFAQRVAFARNGRIGKWLRRLPIVHAAHDTLFVHAGLSPRFAELTRDELDARAREELELFLDTVHELEERKVFDLALGYAELYLLVESERAAGGPAPEIAPLFERLEKLAEGLLFREDGPLWYRGLAEEDEGGFAREVARILRKQRVERVVIGHTQTKSLRIEGRFDHRVLMIDTGMNHEFYGGTPSALLFLRDGEIRRFQ